MITRPAPKDSKPGDFFAGTIGFDLYVALLATKACLPPPKLPKDLFPCASPTST
jgi:hypothetical protein